MYDSEVVRTTWAIVSVAACGSSPPPITSCDPLRGPPFEHFADVTQNSGVDFMYGSPDFKGGALAVADLDGDGLPEIVGGSRIGGLALYHNLGGLRFEDVTVASGLDAARAVQAIAAVDLDNDGDLDLVLAGNDVAVVMANDGAMHFTLAQQLFSTGASEQLLPADFDGDGLLDLYFANYDRDSPLNTTNRLYVNRGGLQFALDGLVGTGWSWSATAYDFDGDGDQDIYVANDTLLADFGNGAPATSDAQPDQLMRNDGPGSDGHLVFTDVAAQNGLTTPRSSMSGLLGDFDDDGKLDLYVTNWGAKKMFMTAEAGGFTEQAQAMGVAGIARVNAACGRYPQDEDCLLLSWGPAATDFDLDGYDELLVLNGITFTGGPPPVLMFQRGEALPYHEVAPDLACVDGRALVASDLDGDGDPDIAIGGVNGPLLVYETTGTPAASSWLRVVLHGHASNRNGIGAVVTITMTSGRTQMRVIGGGGVLNTSSPEEAFFGLGQDAVQALDVRWPSGQTSHIDQPPLGMTLIVEEGT